MARVVHIKLDDAGFGDFACYGHLSALTPNIDSLATNGRKFTRFYVSNPVCSPSRAGFLTGRHGQFSRVFRADQLTGDKCWLPPGTTTVAHWCQLAGAATGLFGKWHLGHPGGPQRRGAGMPTVHGFDEWFIHPYIWENLSTYIDRPWIGHTFPNPPVEIVSGHLSDLTAQKAIAFIQNHAEEDFYLHVEFFAAHHPLEDIEDEGLAGGPLPAYAGATTDERRYWRQLGLADRRIGDIIAALSAEGILGDTYVFVTSDNGPASNQTPGSAGGLRGLKLTLWEGGTRVPFLCQGPGVSAGSVDDSPRTALDWIVTMGGIFGFDVSAYSGSDLLSAVGTRDLFWEQASGQPGTPSGYLTMVRGDIKLHRYVADGSDDHFYDVSTLDGEAGVNELVVGADITTPEAEDMQAALTVWQTTVPTDSNPNDSSTADDMAEAVDIFNEWYADEVSNFSVHFVGADSGALDALEVILNDLGDLPRTHTLPWGGTLEETDLATRRGTHDTMGGPSLIMSRKEWLACFDATKRARLSAPQTATLDAHLAVAVGQRDNR